MALAAPIKILQVACVAEVAELVDAPDLGSGGFICAGSSPVLGTFLAESLERRAKSWIFNYQSALSFELRKER
jgi:hypothetical protein